LSPDFSFRPADRAPLAFLEDLYCEYNRRRWVPPDPLEFLYRYPCVRDREIAGLVASSLAYGRVAQIHRNVASALDRMGPSPFAYLQRSCPGSLRRDFKDFKHRFTAGDELASVLFRVKQMMEAYGSLENGFVEGMQDSDPNVLVALKVFVAKLKDKENFRSSMFLPSPAGGSACKRLNLFLRWMVRRDAVDPGGWDRVPPSKLIVPLDTHKHKVSILLGLTCRRQADMRTALEVTAGFREMAPDDPVRYDFALTRFGIRKDLDAETLAGQCR
jgi:uncharacterized protein (TIGR02757 family)